MKLDRLSKSLGKIWRALFSPRHFSALIRHKVLAGTEHGYVLSGPLNTIVDIGSNRGQFALTAREQLPDATIISFEPLSGPAEVYRSVFAGDRRAILHQVAIGPCVEYKRMHISARDDSSSLLEISEIQTEKFPGTGEVGTTEVLVSPLDRFVSPEILVRPSLLKLDVQGYEFEALSGCESLLNCFDRIYCECSFVELYSGQKMASDIIAWLSSRGFELIGLYNLVYDDRGQTLQADCLFGFRIPSSRSAVDLSTPCPS